METKKSTPTKIEFKNTWNGPNGDVHYFNIEMANGDKGQYGSKSNPQKTFTVGTETDYTIEKVVNGEHVNFKIKPVQNGAGGFKGKPFDPEWDKIKNKLIIRQSSLGNAVQFGALNPALKLSSDDVLKLAEKFYNWIVSPVKEKL